MVDEDFDEDLVDASSPAERRAHQKRLRLQEQASAALQAIDVDNEASQLDQSLDKDREGNIGLDRADSVHGSLKEHENLTAMQPESS